MRIENKMEYCDPNDSSYGSNKNYITIIGYIGNII